MVEDRTRMDLLGSGLVHGHGTGVSSDPFIDRKSGRNLLHRKQMVRSITSIFGSFPTSSIRELWHCM